MEESTILLQQLEKAISSLQRDNMPDKNWCDFTLGKPLPIIISAEQYRDELSVFHTVISKISESLSKGKLPQDYGEIKSKLHILSRHLFDHLRDPNLDPQSVMEAQLYIIDTFASSLSCNRQNFINQSKSLIFLSEFIAPPLWKFIEQFRRPETLTYDPKQKTDQTIYYIQILGLTAHLLKMVSIEYSDKTNAGFSEFIRDNSQGSLVEWMQLMHEGLYVIAQAKNTIIY